MALVTLAALRARVGQPQSMTDHDPLLTDLEAESVQWLESMTGRPIAWVEDVPEMLNGTGDCGPLPLPYEVTKPDTAPHAIVSADITVQLRERIGDDFEAALASTAYEIRWDRLRHTHLITLTDGDVFPRGRDTVLVTYSGAGWGLDEDEPVPRADIAGLDLELAMKRFRERSLINAASDRRDDPAWELSAYGKGVLDRYTNVYGRRRAASRAVSR